MGDIFMREPVEGFVQGHGIGRGERAIGFAVGRNHACGAKRGRAQPELRPDLPCEGGDGCLAAGAGDGGYGGGLRRIKTRSCGAEGLSHIGRHDQRRAGQWLCRCAFCDNRHRAGL